MNISKKLKATADLQHIRSMTKKALKAERNASRTTWDGCRATTYATTVDKKRRSDRQSTKAKLKAYCY
jgi:hypothetical protein